jgi:hypothetical protein
MPGLALSGRRALSADASANASVPAAHGRFLDNPPPVAPLTVMSYLRHRRLPAIALGVALALHLPGCGAGDDDSTAPVDGLPSDGAAADATSLDCDPDRTRQVPNGGPITVGAYCDDIVTCADDAAAAADIEAAAPDFMCEETQSIDCRFRCWFLGEGGSGEVDAGVMEEVCAVSLLLDDPDMVECLIYL